MSSDVLIIAVEENETSMRASADVLFPSSWPDRVLKVRSYAEAAGIIAAHREGIFLEAIMGSGVDPIQVTEL
jgi:Protein of unknown function (DUF3326)